MDEPVSVPQPPVSSTTPSFFFTWTRRLVCLGLAFFGACVIWTLGLRLANELRALSGEWAEARDREPVGYVGISSDNPEFRPKSCIREEGGKVYLWAGSGVKGQAGWFDVSATDLPLLKFEFAFGRDRIRTIDYPIFQTADGEIARRIYPERPVLGLVINGLARAYPLTVMEKVEVVNDTFGDVSVAVTYCPLLQQAAVYNRELNGSDVSLGTSGYCYLRAFVLYDRRTDSLWHPQEEGLKAITGPLTGTVLAKFPEQLESTSWGEWQRRYPDTKVLVGGDRSRGIPVHQTDEATARASASR